MTTKQNSAAEDSVAAKQEPAASQDSPKRQGDKLSRAAGAPLPASASANATSGDSPKRHGDELDHAVREASKH